MSWGTATLGEIAKIERNSIAPTEIAAGSRYVGLEHIESGGASVSFGEVANGELASSKFRFGPGHILFGKLRPYLAKIACPDFEGICSTDILPIAPGRRIDQRYLLHFLRRPETVNWATGRATGVNLPRLSPSELTSLEIPLPPLDEQRRIAAILDKADALRRKRKRAIELLDGLTQLLFLEMFGDPRVPGSRWPLLTFSQACNDVTARSEKLQRSQYLTFGIFPIIDQGQQFIAGWTDDEASVTKVSKPVVVFGDHTRSVKFVDFDFVVGADGAKVLHPTSNFRSLFFSHLLRLMPIPDLGYSRHMRAVKELTFPCPPAERQSEFETKARRIVSERQKGVASLGILEALFSSLQHRAFTGQL